MAGAAVPTCALCAVGGRLGTSLGENRLPTYHLSPLWSETKQLVWYSVNPSVRAKGGLAGPLPKQF